jgi:hypothetical protein
MTDFGENFWKKAGKKYFWTEKRKNIVAAFADKYYPKRESIYYLNYGFSIHMRIDGVYTSNTFSKWGQHNISHKVWVHGETRLSNSPQSKAMISELAQAKVLDDSFED